MILVLALALALALADAGCRGCAAMVSASGGPGFWQGPDGRPLGRARVG
jgi:hypothetical protein